MCGYCERHKLQDNENDFFDFAVNGNSVLWKNRETCGTVGEIEVLRQIQFDSSVNTEEFALIFLQSSILNPNHITLLSKARSHSSEFLSST